MIPSHLEANHSPRLWGSEGNRRLTKCQSTLSGRSRPLLRRAARVGGEAFLFLLTLSLSSCRGPKGDWELVWEDNFDSGVLDTTLWSRTTRGRADWQDTQSDDPRCLEMRDGHLVLRGIVNDNPNDTAQFLTGGVWTIDKKALQPGRIEVRARLHKAKGAWPAIWTMGFDRKAAPWPKGGEIDIMERLNGDSIAYQTAHSHWTYYVNHNRSKPVHGGSGAIDPDGWNVYAVDIHPDSLVFHINGITTFTYHRVDSIPSESQFPYFRTQYLLIDMQLGGKWVGSVDPADLPVEMEIDWVRNWVRRKKH